MTIPTPISATAAHYTGLHEQLLAEKLVMALRCATYEQRRAKDAEIALRVLSDDQFKSAFGGTYEDVNNALKDQQIEFWRIVDQLGIDMKLVREMVA